MEGHKDAPGCPEVQSPGTIPKYHPQAALNAEREAEHAQALAAEQAAEAAKQAQVN